MPVLKKVWDNKPDDGEPRFVEMFSLNAIAAVKHDPRRYSFGKPGDEPRSVEQRRAAVEPNDVEIPDNFSGLPWPERKKLALSLGADRNCTSDIANAIISAEQKRRSNFKPAEPTPGSE